MQVEASRQAQFEEGLAKLRAQLEDAVFAKPVCAECEELCRV